MLWRFKPVNLLLRISSFALNWYPILLCRGESDLIARSGLVNNRRVNHYRGENDAASKKESDKKMKKLTSAVLGLSLTLAAAGLTFAAQAPATTPAQTAAPATAPTAKKHVKKTKKSKPASDAPAATPATK